MNTIHPINSTFRPARWLPGGHCQTLWPARLARRPYPRLWLQRFALADGDFVDLAWNTQDYQGKQPLAVLFHGLEGSARSPYIRGMTAALARQGYAVVVMHFRGCSGEPNCLPRAYHSGETNDARVILDHLADTYQPPYMVAVGYSLGGNMLAKYLAEQQNRCPLQAAVVVSAPLDLKSCSLRINTGFSRIYQRYLLSSMKHRHLLKMSQMINHQWPSTTEQVKNSRTFFEFDDCVTAPLHGFIDAEDYYQRCSAKPLLSAISTPTLIIHSADDPFMSHQVIPRTDMLSPTTEYELCVSGGHVGFVDGPFWRPGFYLERRIPSWLAQHRPVCTLAYINQTKSK